MDGFEGPKVTDDILEKHLVAICAPGEGEYDAKAALGRFRAQSTMEQVLPKSGGRVSSLRTIGLSATLLAVLLVVVKYLPSTTPISQSKTYTTTPGQRANITLSDGTKIILNVGSRLNVPADFGIKNRTIDLDGEAQFDVVHNASLPLTVRANGVLVRDLATVFVVRAYRGLAPIRVAVRSGRVSVQSPVLTMGSAVTLSANQAASIAQNGIPQVSSMSGNEGFFAWTHGELVFRQVPLGEALAELSRWYGLEFRAGDAELLNYSISAHLPESFDINKLQDVAGAIGARAERVGSVVTFHSRSNN